MPSGPKSGRSPVVAQLLRAQFPGQGRNVIGAAEHVVHLIHHGSTSARGRSHATPTPDPDPRDSGHRTPRAGRCCDNALCGHDAATHRRDRGATG